MEFKRGDRVRFTSYIEDLEGLNATVITLHDEDGDALLKLDVPFDRGIYLNYGLDDDDRFTIVYDYDEIYLDEEGKEPEEIDITKNHGQYMWVYNYYEQYEGNELIVPFAFNKFKLKLDR